jgi:4-amino-4-deoxy-L-arabinose transferase-like glycosyltransferase
MSDVGAVRGHRKTQLLGRLLDSLIDRLFDPGRRERTVLGLLASYAAIWSIYGAIAKSSQDVHFDMGEMVAWSREVGFGTPKHPPLPAWLVRAWFGVFPLEDWSYYLFAILLATVALWIAWKASAPYLTAEKRVIGLALLTLVPFYNFHALKFNANTVMTPLWALTTWWFLRSYETRSPTYAVLAGLAAAAAMLGKYWSVILLLGLALAALADRRRGDYLRSSAPWLTIATGIVGIAPHLLWLYAHDFKPFDYALESHAATAGAGLLSGLGYVAGAAGYLAAPILIAVAAARPTWSAVGDTIWPSEPARRLVLLAFLIPLLLPIVAAVAAKEEVVSLWAIGSMTLVPVVLLSSADVTIARPQARRILGLAIAVPIVAAALSPAIAIVIHRRGVPNYATHYRLVAQAAEKVWRETTDQPLRMIGSYDNLLYGAVLYFPQRPSTLEITNPSVTPWVDEARIAREGIALFCPLDEARCVQAMNDRAARSPAGKRVEVVLSRTYWGVADAPVRYVIVTIPPGILQPIMPAKAGIQ